MCRGDVYICKSNNERWTIVSFDKKKQIVTSIRGERIKKSDYKYFLNTHRRFKNE